MDYTKVKEGDSIRYIGESIAYGGNYKTVAAESTFLNQEDCPEKLKGKLVIIEFMNDGTPMFFPVHLLDPNDWEIVKEEK